jgi:hypothetical protein
MKLTLADNCRCAEDADKAEVDATCCRSMMRSMRSSAGGLALSLRVIEGRTKAWASCAGVGIRCRVCAHVPGRLR